MISVKCLLSFSPLPPFGVRDYVCLDASSLDVKLSQSTPLYIDWNWVYATRHGFDRLPAAGDLVKRSMNWSSCNDILRGDEVTYVDIPFVRCSEKEFYIIFLVSFVCSTLPLADAISIIHSLKYVVSSRFYNSSVPWLILSIGPRRFGSGCDFEIYEARLYSCLEWIFAGFQPASAWAFLFKCGLESPITTKVAYCVFLRQSCLHITRIWRFKGIDAAYCIVFQRLMIVYMFLYPFSRPDLSVVQSLIHPCLKALWLWLNRAFCFPRQKVLPCFYIGLLSILQCCQFDFREAYFASHCSLEVN